MVDEKLKALGITDHANANFSVDTPLGQAIAAYTGRDVIALEVRPDPVLENVFAVKATLETVFKNLRGRKRQRLFREDFFLVKTRLALVTPDDLEEVEFTEWPPTSKAVR